MTDRVILVCTVLIAAIYLYATTLIPSLEIGDPLGPKAFPRLLGVGLLLAAGMLGMEIWAKRKANTTASAKRGPTPKENAATARREAPRLRKKACTYGSVAPPGAPSPLFPTKRETKQTSGAGRAARTKEAARNDA